METNFEQLTSNSAARIEADDLQTATPQVGLLAGDGLHTVVTAAGSGFVAFGGRDLTRWHGDRVADDDGVFFYLRDVESGTFWSAGYQPTRRVPARYEARFGRGVVEIEREDEGIETRMAVCAAPDAPVELRCLVLTNHSDRPRRIEVTSYAELVLHHRAADRAHPAFSKLFVETEKVEGRAILLARRRPRSHDDVPVWAAHFTDAADAWETDRLRFLGRGRDRSNPRALDADVALSGTTGPVLDPVASFRRAVDLAPGASVEVVFGLAGGGDRDEVMRLAERFGDPGAVREAFSEAAAQATASLDALDVSEEDAARFDRWAAGLLYGDPALRAPHVDPRAAHVPIGTLGTLHVSATDPLAVARIETDAALDVLPTLLKAKGYWASRGLHVPLVVLAGDDVREEVEDVVADSEGVHVAALAALSDEVIALVETAARLWMADALPETDEEGTEPLDERYVPSPPAFAPLPDEDLLHFNGYGGFSADGTEYVLRIAPDGDGRLTLPPLPWVNVVANEQVGFLATERGALHTWVGNSRENRLTPWTNDPVTDPYGEAFYVRDDATGEFWSPTPGPVSRRAPYEVRHGWGYTTYRHTADGIGHEVTHFVPCHDPVRLTRVRLTNRGDAVRRLTLVSYARLVLGGEAETTGRFVVTDAVGETLLARNPTAGEFANCVAFAGVSAGGTDVQFTTDRAAFLGRHGTPAAPRALRTGEPLDGATGAVLDPCFAFAVPVEVPPGETVEVDVMLGQVRGEAAALNLAEHYRSPEAVRDTLNAVRAFWQRTVSAVQIETPRPELDLLVNGWLTYQNLSCRMWGRTAYYQSGGAFGFRDQLQDSSALIYARPDLTREQILLHAAHQFVEGDVMHWWHPPTSKGIRTRFSDDLLWLPYVTAFYVETTGDASVLDASVRFLTARELKEGEDEVFLTPEDAGTEASVYEHCCRALDRSLTKGRHGLPLMGTGDWNDGMNSVGDEGRGESVWLGFFLADILHHFLPICERRGDDDHAARYRAYLADLEAALNDAGWDGDWYRRAYYDDGAPMGSAGNDECQIDAIAQGWSVISGVAPPERIEQALDAAENYLVQDNQSLIRLLTPPFDTTKHNPGYIKGYVPGVRENGGQYTHGVLWLIRAFAEAGRTDRAADLLAMLSPVHHTRDTAAADRYKTEPYVVAADVYSVSPHIGRGGWTWYTGSAGWTFRVAVESILGFGIEGGDTLTLDPRIPDDWPGFSLRYRLPEDGGTVEIEVTRGDEAAATFDGDSVNVRDSAVRVPLPKDGETHHLRLVLSS